MSIDGSASESLEKSNHTERSEDNSAGLQEQGLTPQTNILGADRGDAVVVAEEGRVGRNDLATRPVTTLLLPSTTPASSPEMQGLAHSPPAGMQGSGRPQEEPRADMGNPTKSAIDPSELGCARSQGGAHVKGGVGVTPQRQFEVWDLLFELDYYHLFLCMALTSVSGLYIIGKVSHSLSLLGRARVSWWYQWARSFVWLLWGEWKLSYPFMFLPTNMQCTIHSDRKS